MIIVEGIKLSNEQIILEILEDCQIEMMNHVEDYLHDKNLEYVKLNESIKDLIESYPRILQIENINSAMCFNRDEVNAMKELYMLELSMNVLRENEIYRQGVRDCFEVIIATLGCDVSKINYK